LVFVLLSSIASFTTGVEINTALAKKSSSSKDGGNGDSGGGSGGGDSSSPSNNDKGTGGDNQGGGGGTSDSNTGNTNNNPTSPSPPDNTGTEGQTGATGQEQQQEQQQQCPTGQHFDTNQNTCVNDTTLAPPSQGLARGDLPPSALETSNNPPVSSTCFGQTHYNSDTGKCDDNKQQLPSGGCVEGYTLGNDGLCHNAAAEAAAAAAGVIDIPPDGKCPPGYHMVKTPGSQKNVCFPNPPIDKSSPEAAVLPQTTPPSPSPAAKAAEAAAAAAAGAISIPPDGKCPPGYHLQDNWCYPDPITKNSPEAATRQGIAGSTNTLSPSEGANPANQFGSLPPSALETNTANCPAGSHSDAPRGTCFPNSQPLSAGGCAPGWHLVSDTHCEKDFAKIDTIPPNTTGDLPLEVGPSKFGQDTQNSIPPASTNPPVTPAANPASQPECEPGFHWDNSQQQCIADSKSDPNNNPDSSRQDLLEKLARSPGDPIISSPGDPVKPDRYPPDPVGPNTFGQNNIPPNPIGPK
jgi:hypothetical protein